MTRLEEKKRRVRLFFTYMPHIKFQDPKLFLSFQLPKAFRMDRWMNRQAKTNMPLHLSEVGGIKTHCQRHTYMGTFCQSGKIKRSNRRGVRSVFHLLSLRYGGPLLSTAPTITVLQETFTSRFPGTLWIQVVGSQCMNSKCTVW